MRLFDKIKEVREKGGIRRIVFHTIPYNLYKVFDPVIGLIVKSICLKKPMQDIIIIESHNDFDNNGGAFYDYLIENGFNKKYKLVWFLRNKAPRNLPENVHCVRYARLSIKRWYYHCLAKYIVCGHFMIESIRKEQLSIYTTHASLSLKNPKGYIHIPKNVNYYLCPSENVASIIADAFMMDYPNEKQLILGFPDLDVLHNSVPGDLFRITDREYKKKILWMPTFRKTNDGRSDSDYSYDLGIPLIKTEEEFCKLNQFLKKLECLLIIKLHPMQNLSSVKVKSMSNVIILSGDDVKKLGVDNYRLMKDADALISDYSAAASDYLQLDRPLAYSVDDLKEYKLGFIVEDPRELMAGHLLYDLEDLFAFVNDVIYDHDKYKAKRKTVREYIFKYNDGDNCKRLAQFLGIEK